MEKIDCGEIFCEIFSQVAYNVTRNTFFNDAIF